MKQFVQLIGGALLFGILSLAIGYWISHDNVKEEQEELYVYNWGEYIDPALLQKFEKQTGIKVIYETFDSNEAMEAKIRNGGTHYDVAFPSDYTIEKMKQSNLLIPLNHEQIPNMKHLDAHYMDQPFDRKNVYSIPYFFGTVGILYDQEKYPDMKFEHWSDLKDPRLANDVIFVDGAREVIGLGLNSLGYSLNDADAKHLDEAEAHLKTYAPNIRGVVGDEVTMMLEQHEASVAVMWSGSAAPLFQEDDRFNYVVPKEGSNLWFDNMVIPKTAQNVDGAHKFINFLHDPEVNRQNAEWVAYATPNKTARNMLPEEIKNDERVYPTEETQQRLEVYKDLGTDVLSEYNERFLNFKMAL
ncbi:spermidine/putrescine ABC transporter substrate-binding protein [Staphylococcus muscae]|uniref:Spermidine/putrescine ABC transporter substrate-binding protein n=1 Tax=Staphylococcus muscae TaxID=1294 RepID=A0A240C0A2_9STAP|nr:spermidine/putrescine ABC transporter substrate-binding protein [Staphylococcus muscae]AVQ32730.1 spermidine/putrescine ABC transporter substrate-binding protein [Staphylococcus muscae]PNZ05356.1 spermidine/putrescine ABC transporter substrate-binding protein [Staphylococcus muscae]GGA81601.1 spermidine/putrescine ABC transporter substrate-binding protein [Staphylococcus muscae]SNW01457.1 spermidine/putrescine-binding periplasmic protein PotD [Staphylococcus muscae]